VLFAGPEAELNINLKVTTDATKNNSLFMER
jgi:hypothetical protein